MSSLSYHKHLQESARTVESWPWWKQGFNSQVEMMMAKKAAARKGTRKKASAKKRTDTPTLRDWFISSQGETDEENNFSGLCDEGQRGYRHILKGLLDGKSTVEIYDSAPDDLKEQFHQDTDHPSNNGSDNDDYICALGSLFNSSDGNEPKELVAAVKNEIKRVRDLEDTDNHIPVLSWAKTGNHVNVTWEAKK